MRQLIQERESDRFDCVGMSELMMDEYRLWKSADALMFYFLDLRNRFLVSYLSLTTI